MPSTWHEGLEEDYLGGLSLRQCAVKHGISVETVRRHLLEEGVKLRPPGERTRLYPKGSCRKCGIAMVDYYPEPREICGDCERD